MYSALVGQRFYPNAQRLLNALPRNTQLQIIPEPSNPYDDLALKVVITREELSKVDDEDIAEILEASPDKTDWQLGHVSKLTYTPVHEALNAGHQLHTALTFDGNGYPQLSITPIDSDPTDNNIEGDDFDDTMEGDL